MGTATAAELLAQQHSQLSALETLLTQENEILQQHQPDALNDITAQKNDLLLAIQTLDQHIGQHAGFVAEKATGAFDETLAEIEHLLSACKKQNQVNGMIIQHSQLAVERMKTNLLESNNKSSVTYDNKGKKSGGLSSIGIKA
ncbi:flagella synthesis protein FlgN [Thalassotalea sp. PLHSN55]|uniref:flagella synthesis protein FlgN n=1 Tax=Thalassotalea sp. PLHSN55 TaxID=3435888 RepID=UPI003F87D553